MKTLCSECRKNHAPFGVDLNTNESKPVYTIDGKATCEDCYFSGLGDLIEKNPIHTPGRTGRGGNVEVPKEE